MKKPLVLDIPVRDPAKADPRVVSDIHRNRFRSPEEHNQSLAVRKQPPLTRAEVAQIYGFHEAQRLFDVG